jgi:prevent-host-death family protein
VNGKLRAAAQHDMVINMVISVKKDANVVIPAGEFKAKCLALMDRVAKDRRSITITKHGKPVAILSPPQVIPVAAFGFAKDDIEILGDIESPIGIRWDADT